MSLLTQPIARVTALPLQSFIDELVRGDIFGAAVSVFGGVVPIPIMATLIFGSIGLSYYMVQRSAVIPFIMFLLIGGVTISRAPTTVQQGIIGGFVIALTAIGYLLLQRVRT